MIITDYSTSKKAELTMPISWCTARRDVSWAGVTPAFMGEVSVHVFDRKRTAVLATTDQVVPGTRAWSPPT